MSDTEPHELGALEGEQAAPLAGSTIVSAAYPTVFGTLLLVSASGVRLR